MWPSFLPGGGSDGASDFFCHNFFFSRLGPTKRRVGPRPGSGVQTLSIMLKYQSRVFFRSAGMKGGWIIPAGSIPGEREKKRKDYAYLWKLFNGVRIITGCFIQAEAESDLNQPPTISLLSQAIISPAPPNSLLLWESPSPLKKDQMYFLCRTTCPPPLKPQGLPH